MSFRILFAGTPAIAIPSLDALAASGRVVGVLTAPDARSGRGQTLQPCEVKARALELGLPVLQPEKLDGSAREAVAALRPDLLVCIAYGKIFGPKFLALFPQGGINLHPSLLPRYRGPSPINAAILAGDARTGITVQHLSEGMDEGDVILQEVLELSGRETTLSLQETCAVKGAAMLLDAVTRLESGTATRTPQDSGKASYCHLIQKDDGKIDWNRPADEIERLVRASTPWPRAWTTWEGQKLYLDQVSLVEDSPEANPTPAGSSPASPSLEIHPSSESPSPASPEKGSPGEAGLEHSPKPESAVPGHVPGKVLKVDKKLGFLVQTSNGILAVRQLQLQSKKSMDHSSFHNGARSFPGSVLGE